MRSISKRLDRRRRVGRRRSQRVNKSQESAFRSPRRLPASSPSPSRRPVSPPRTNPSELPQESTGTRRRERVRGFGEGAHAVPHRVVLRAPLQHKRLLPREQMAVQTPVREREPVREDALAAARADAVLEVHDPERVSDPDAEDVGAHAHARILRDGGGGIHLRPPELEVAPLAEEALRAPEVGLARPTRANVRSTAYGTEEAERGGRGTAEEDGGMTTGGRAGAGRGGGCARGADARAGSCARGSRASVATRRLAGKTRTPRTPSPTRGRARERGDDQGDGPRRGERADDRRMRIFSRARSRPGRMKTIFERARGGRSARASSRTRGARALPNARAEPLPARTERASARLPVDRPRRSAAYPTSPRVPGAVDGLAKPSRKRGGNKCKGGGGGALQARGGGGKAPPRTAAEPRAIITTTPTASRSASSESRSDAGTDDDESGRSPEPRARTRAPTGTSAAGTTVRVGEAPGTGASRRVARWGTSPRAGSATTARWREGGAEGQSRAALHGGGADDRHLGARRRRVRRRRRRGRGGGPPPPQAGAREEAEGEAASGGGRRRRRAAAGAGEGGTNRPATLPGTRSMRGETARPLDTTARTGDTCAWRSRCSGIPCSR